MSVEPSPPSAEVEKIEHEAMALERKPWYADLHKQVGALWYGLAGRGPKVALQGTLEILSRWVRGAPISHYSQITPEITVSGQYQKHGWRILAKRGITAVINMRTEWDDQAAGIAPPRYMHLKVIDNTPPTLEMLQAGVDFIKQEIDNGGKVYIHCAAGVGRAPTMAAAYLISTGMKPEDALKQIRDVRPFIRPTAEQIAQLHAFYAKLLMEREGVAAMPVVDVAREMAVSTAAAESTVAVPTDAAVKPLAPIGTGEAVKAGMPEQVGAAPSPRGNDPAPEGTVLESPILSPSPEIQAKDVAQSEGGAKADGSDKPVEGD